MWGDFLRFLHFNIRMSKLLPGCCPVDPVSQALGPPLRRNGRAGALSLVFTREIFYPQ